MDVQKTPALIPAPIFIVGAPRSGTKLLRNLLNNHPEISLGNEGNFIPRFVRRFGLTADLSQPQLWEEIYEDFSHSAYYSSPMQKNVTFSRADFVAALTARQNLVWADIFEVLLRPYGPNPHAHIYGDKSHGYLSNVVLLRTIFPHVRFLFLVRDPRDQALSAAAIWKRHPLRSAQLWAELAHKAEKFGLDASPDALTVRYEDLTSETEAELKRVCAFLHLDYAAEMHLLKKPAESERNGRQLKSVTKQHAKYRDRLPPETIRGISEIALPYLAKYGYPEEGASRPRKLSYLQRRVLSYRDGLFSLRFHVKEKGLRKGAVYYLKRRSEAAH